MTGRRLDAAVSLLLLTAAVVVLAVMVVTDFPRGPAVVAVVAVAAVAGWQALRHRGTPRLTWLVGCVALLVAAVAVVLTGGNVAEGLIAVALLLLSVGSAKRAFTPHVTRAPATPPTRAIVIWNPKSGGGKALTNHLADEARKRGIEPIELKPGDDLVQLVRDAVAGGADALAAAGGDGTQALVATIAAEHDLPFACIPAGTRNHFALDLNLDRADPRLALDAFVEGVERRVDHGLAGDRFFVNNVSMGIYPHVVDDPDYRDGRIKAAASIIPELMDPDTPSLSLRFDSPTGTHYDTAQVLLVSNNPYRGFAALDGAGRRVSLDGGELGVLVIAASDPDELSRGARRTTMGVPLENVEGFDQWTAPALRVDSDDATVLAGIDGEALEMPVPLDIRVVPGGLRVIVPVGTPDTPVPTPSLLSLESIANLVGLAGGVSPDPYDDRS